MSAVPMAPRRKPVDLSGDAPVIVLGGERIPCVKQIAPGAFLDVAASSDPDAGVARQAAAFNRFLYSCVARGQEARLESLLFRKEDDDGDPVDIDDLAEIVMILSEHYASRPTTRRSPSAGGPSRPTGSSTGDSPSPESPPVLKTVSLAKKTVVESTSDGTSTS